MQWREQPWLVSKTVFAVGRGLIAIIDGITLKNCSSTSQTSHRLVRPPGTAPPFNGHSGRAACPVAQRLSHALRHEMKRPPGRAFSSSRRAWLRKRTLFDQHSNTAACWPAAPQAPVNPTLSARRLNGASKPRLLIKLLTTGSMPGRDPRECRQAFPAPPRYAPCRGSPQRPTAALRGVADAWLRLDG